jgi:hypothetical protein
MEKTGFITNICTTAVCKAFFKFQNFLIITSPKQKTPKKKQQAGT